MKKKTYTKSTEITKNQLEDVVDYMKKSMFKGQHADLIEKCYRMIAVKE